MRIIGGAAIRGSRGGIIVSMAIKAATRSRKERDRWAACQNVKMAARRQATKKSGMYVGIAGMDGNFWQRTAVAGRRRLSFGKKNNFSLASSHVFSEG
jgi:hypothetical protein